MKIGAYARTATLSILSLFAASCQRGPLKKIQPPRQIVHSIDSLKTIVNKGIDSTYCPYQKDTFEISCYIPDKINKFVENINSDANLKIPNEMTGYTFKIEEHQIGGQTDLIPKTKNKYVSKYINPKVKIGNGFFSDENGIIYVPVEYYGQKNPLLTKK